MKKNLIALVAALALSATAASAQAPTTSPASTTAVGTTADVKPGRQMRKGGRDGMHQDKNAKTPAQKADHRAAKMAKQLGLTADQEAKVESILLAQAQEMQALKTKYAGSTDHKAMRPEAQALRTKYDGQLRQALGAEAYARYDKMRDEHSDKGKRALGPKAKDGKTKVKVKS